MASNVPYRIGGATITYKYDIVAVFAASATTDTSDPFEIYLNSTAGNVFTGSIDTPIGSCTFGLSGRDFSGPSGKAKQVTGTLTSYGDSDGDTVNTSGASNWDIDNGVFSISVACDVCLVLTNPLTGTGDLAPFWDRIEDSPPNTAVEIQLIPVADATTTGTLSLGGLSLSVSGSVGSDPAPITLFSSLDGNLRSSAASHGGSGSASATGTLSVSLNSASTIASSALVGLTITQTSDSSSANAETGIESISFDCSAGAGGTSGSSGESHATRGFFGVRGANLSGIVAYPYAAGAAVPIAEAVRVLLTGCSVAYIDTSTGTFSDTVSQDSASGYVSANAISTTDANDPVEDSNSVDTYSSVACSLQAASLTTRGDDSTARRLPMRGEAVEIATVAQASTVTVDTGSTLAPTGAYAGDWSASSGWTASISGGAVVASGTGEGTLTRTFDADCGYFAGYRFLKFSVGSDAAATITVKINTTFGVKSWSLTLAGTGLETLYLDMLYPTDAVDDHDATFTRYPEDADNYPAEGVYFGVGRVSSIEFSGLAEGTEYTLDALTLCRKASAGSGFSAWNSADNISLVESLGYLPEIYPENVVSESGTTTRYYGNRCILAQPDAMGNALEEWGLLKSVTTGGETGTESTTYTHQSVAGLAARLSPRYPGVTITQSVDSTPSGDVHPPAKYELYNITEAYLAWVWGNGLLATAAGWEIGNGLSWADVGTVQPIFDTLLGWPSLKAGNQDWFNLSGESDSDRPFTLRAGTILRGNVFGEVSTDREPAATETVAVTQSATARGDDASDSTGWYETTDPATQPGSAEASCRGDMVTFTAYTRLLQRVVWASVAEALGLSVDTNGAGLTAYAVVESGTIHVHRSENWATTSFDDEDSAIDGKRPWLRFWPDASERLSMLYVSGGTIYHVHSDQSGKAGSWSMAVSVGSGTVAGSDVHPAGWELVAVRTDAGAIEGYWLDQAGATIRDGITILASGAANVGVGVTYDSPAQKWYVFYKTTGGTITRLASSDGITWA